MVEELAQRLSRNPTRVAAVDCGTNTIKLLVADLDLDTGVSTVHERTSRMVRLGQGVDRTGRFADEALERTFVAVEEYAALVADHHVAAIRFCATSAARDASNGAVFRGGVRARIGVDPEVLSGLEEAQLAYAGALRHLAVEPVAPVLVIDIGGGSTELILGDGQGRVLAEHSMDIGAVRLHERHLHTDPPTEAEVAAVVADIEAALDGCPVDVAGAATVVGVAGTILTVAAGALDLPAYDRELIDQTVLAHDDVHAQTSTLLAKTVGERLTIPSMHPGRADVIGAGALVLDRILRRTTVPTLVVSEADILDGIAWSIA